MRCRFRPLAFEDLAGWSPFLALPPSGAGLITSCRSHRDAADRAARCQTPRELRELLARAEAAGDTQLRRARLGQLQRHSRQRLRRDRALLARRESRQDAARPGASQRARRDRPQGKAALSNRLHFDLQVDKSLGHLSEYQVLAQTGREEQAT
jgi:hypothetical protein